jgi:hypothetical protein
MQGALGQQGVRGVEWEVVVVAAMGSSRAAEGTMTKGLRVLVVAGEAG